MEPRRELENVQHDLLKALEAVYVRPNNFLRPFAETPEQALLALAKDPGFFGPYVSRLGGHEQARLLRAVHQAAMRCLDVLAEHA